MKIPEKLESMVADLISDERKERERVEGILSQIHELTEPFFNPPSTEDQVWPEGSPQRRRIEMEAHPSKPVQHLSDAERVANFTKAFERRGMPPDRARDAAEEECGLRDGRL